jgi:hypothetical protein
LSPHSVTPENPENTQDYRGKIRPFLLTLCQEFWILIARSWQARNVASLFGVASVGLGVYFIWGLQHSRDGVTEIKMITPVVIGALCLSVVSLIVTYYVDKKFTPKP